MKFLNSFYRLIIRLIELGMVFMLIANLWVLALTKERKFDKMSRLPPRKWALVLGTSPKTRQGKFNPYFINRMQTAARLYHYGKIQKILVSGEKSFGYDEPQAMYDYLVYQSRVNPNDVEMDPYGFSTRQSIERCQKYLGIQNIIIISQGYHNLRALFLARNKGLNALAFDARDVDRNESFFRNHGREFLARVDAVIYYIIGISLTD